MFPATGSTMTAAISPGVLAKSAAHGREVVVRRDERVRDGARGTPGESGRPSVATPEPAWTRSRSAWPW